MSNSISILIAGEFVDAHLYGDLLLLWDGSGRLGIVRTAALAAAASSASDLNPKLAKAAFVNNRALDKSDEAMMSAQAWSAESNDDNITVDLHSLAPSFFSVAPDSDVLDLMATYGRLFISTTESLLSARFDSKEVEQATQRLPHTCLSTNPRWGSVTASCASHGGWALVGENQPDSDSQHRTVQFDADVSLRHTWLGSNVLSFDEDNHFDSFRAEVQRGKGKQTRIQAFEPISDAELSEEAWWLDENTDMAHLSGSEYTATFPGSVVSVHGGDVFSTSISTWGGYPQPTSYSELIGQVDGRVHDVVRTSGGYVVETDEALYHLTKDRSQSPLLLERETISLRGYDRSRRYLRSVTATVDGGLLIAALLGSSPDPVSK